MRPGAIPPGGPGQPSVTVISSGAARGGRTANYTMVAKVAKRYLPAVEVYGGAHARLRAIADEHRRSR